MSSFFLEACGKTNKCIFKGITASESLGGTPWTLVPAPQLFPRPEDLLVGRRPPSQAGVAGTRALSALGCSVGPPSAWPQRLSFSSPRFMQHPKNFGLIASFLERKVSAHLWLAVLDTKLACHPLSRTSVWAGWSVCPSSLSLASSIFFPASASFLRGKARQAPPGIGRSLGLQAQAAQESCEDLHHIAICPAHWGRGQF